MSFERNNAPARVLAPLITVGLLALGAAGGCKGSGPAPSPIPCAYAPAPYDACFPWPSAADAGTGGSAGVGTGGAGGAPLVDDGGVPACPSPDDAVNEFGTTDTYNDQWSGGTRKGDTCCYTLQEMIGC